MLNRLGRMQTTLRKAVDLSGIGVHSGASVRLALHPAEAGSGISFLRTDLDSDTAIPADRSRVNATDHCTRVARGAASVATIEHLMASFAALEIDNALVEIDGPEMPIMDGSAADFVAAIDAAGIATLPVARRYVKVLKPVRVAIGQSIGELRPHDGFRLETEIDFAHPLVGRQVFAGDVDAGVFRRDLARARTFGFLADVEKMLAHGLARGASLDNSVVIGDDRVLNPEGLRWTDEFVRHKALDAVGDLALAGAPLIGCYRSYRGGHNLNVRVVDALFADPDAWTFVEMPARREIAHGDMPVMAGAAAYGPDKS